MPLIEIRQLTPHTRLGLWRMDEPMEGSPRQRERQAVQQLLTAMMNGDTSYTIGHEPSGKPILNSPLGSAASPVEEISNLRSALPLGSSKKSQISNLKSQISISHTRGYAALILSDDSEIGIDIEYRSDRVERIASRFIRPDEKAETTDEKLLLWSAKEAVYKLFSEDNLLFFDMRALSIDESVVRMENTKRNIVVDVHYAFTADYVLTYVLQ